MAINRELVERKISLILDDLEKLNILDREAAEQFAKFAGLRNRLAHEYNGIDEKIIYQAVKEIVVELPRYIEEIKDFLDRQR